MPDFHNFIMRHGEFTAQAIVEQIERNEGISGRQLDQLESRWDALMQAAANDDKNRDQDNSQQ